MPPVLVRDLMTAPVVSLFGSHTLPLAEDIMAFKNVRHLPVIDEQGRLVGLVTHRDLLRAQISTLSGLSREARRAMQADVRVEQIMTTGVQAIDAELPAADAGKLLLEHHFGCLPVVDADRRLIGIITERDFLDFALRELAA